MTYDDERVIALLKESVPAVPEVPARVDSVRRLASRRRRAAVVRAVAAAASLLLVVAALVVFRPAGGGDVEPVRDPVPTIIERFRSGSLRAELRQERPAGTTVTVRYEVDLDRRAVRMSGDGTERRVVDGVLYERAEDAAPGTRWTRRELGNGGWPPPPIAVFLEWLPVFRESPIQYVGQATVRGGRVAEYRTAMAEPGDPLHVEFRIFVDAQGRLRRWVQKDEGRPPYSVEYFDWGKRVTVEAPPESEVAG